MLGQHCWPVFSTIAITEVPLALSLTKTSGPNLAGNTCWGRVRYDRSSRVKKRVGKRLVSYLNLRQNAVIIEQEKITPIQLWKSQCCTSEIFMMWNSSGWGYIPGYKDAYARAYSKFRQKAFADSQMALAVDMAERKQTMRLVGSTAKTILKVARSIRKGNFGDAAKALGMRRPPSGVSAAKGFADNWLAYRYGVRPLLGSIQSALSYTENRAPKAFIRACSVRTSVLKKGSGAFYNTDCELFGTVRVVLKGTARITSIDAIRLKDLGVVNPAVVAWEAIPYSFVVDWFIGVAEYLESYTDFVGMAFDDLALTVTYKGSGLYKVRTPFNANGNNYTVGPWFTSDAVLKTRVLLGVPPVPALRIGPKPWKQSRDAARVLDSVSLLGQFFLKNKHAGPPVKPWIQSRNGPLSSRS